MDNKINILSPLSVIHQPNKAFASDDLDIPTGSQPDLLYMKSVLVSTGQNKNDDVFLPSEMWMARNSPVLKPVNWEHNTGSEVIKSVNEELDNPKEVVKGNQIIGAMYNSYVADKNGAIIQQEKINASDFEVPGEFDIINEAVIYKYLFPKVSERIVSQASNAQLFVSMEAWFNKFDYRVGSKVVARNENTAFLDNHLRANGGDGFFGGEKVGRVLRNIVFGGVGIVSNPANVDSVIQSFTNADLKENKQVVHSAIASNIIGTLDKGSQESQEVYEIMSNQKTENVTASTPVAAVSNEDYKDVVQRLVKAEHTIETKDKELSQANEKVEELSQGQETLASVFAKGAEAISQILGSDSGLESATAENFFDKLAQALTDRLSQEDELKSKLAEADRKLEELETAKTLADRKNKIRETLGLTISSEDADDVKSSKADRVEKLVKATESFDVEAFDEWLSETAELLTLSAIPWMDKKKEEEDKKKKEAGKKAKAEDEGIVDVEILDSVKAEASVSAGSDDVTGEPASGHQRWHSLAADLVKATKRVKED